MKRILTLMVAILMATMSGNVYAQKNNAATLYWWKAYLYNDARDYENASANFKKTYDKATIDTNTWYFDL